VATAAADEGLALAQASFGATDPRTARLLAGVAHARWAAGKPDDALALFEQAQQAYRHSAGPDHPSIASAGINISSIHILRHEWDLALAALRPTLALMERAYGPDDPNVADCLGNLSTVLAARGELPEALVASQRAAQIYARRHGPDHLTAITILLEVGFLQATLGQPDAALATLHRGLALRRQAAQPGPDELATIHVLIADVLADERRSELAEVEYQAALAQLGDPSPNLQRDVLRGRAQLARQRGDVAAAITLAREALALDDPTATLTREDLAKRDEHRAPLLHELGEALLAAHDVDAALLACKEAASLSDMSHGPGGAMTQRARLCLGRT
jgi:tetratricopeptide (TPR) repeat protein